MKLSLFVLSLTIGLFSPSLAAPNPDAAVVYPCGGDPLSAVKSSSLPARFRSSRRLLSLRVSTLEQRVSGSGALSQKLWSKRCNARRTTGGQHLCHSPSPFPPALTAQPYSEHGSISIEASASTAIFTPARDLAEDLNSFSETLGSLEVPFDALYQVALQDDQSDAFWDRCRKAPSRLLLVLEKSCGNYLCKAL
ncbi:hypothetical protein BDN70DRAFT_931796 [Pholiota conissans]|uniref:Uncharacterized protein n=1 Tax=Pholiota conissans TaxID=109636 RepID=A0A9P6D1F3_9AGAR|nr:hypothetical protein BDN70DRAFT_931796 [Pholiota conissans]